MADPALVRSMFARIAPRYDLLNRVLSLGIDRRWRARMLARAGQRAGSVRGLLTVDACCGTGDVALAFAREGARVVGVDFTPQMLQHARAKEMHQARSAERAVFVHGDALRLPFKDGSADLCTIAFGIRNVADRGAALREFVRVLRPGGLLLVLEFGMPRGKLTHALYKGYFTRVLPTVGGWVAGDREAYAYLPRTVLAWPDADTFQSEMQAAGLVECEHQLFSRGIACLFSGRKRPSGA